MTNKAGEQPTITQADEACLHCGAEMNCVKNDTEKVHPYCVRCDGCGAQTAWYNTALQAWAAWNTRTTSLAAQDGLVERMARSMVIASGKNPDTTAPAPRGAVGMRYLWQNYEHLAQAALSAIKGDKS